MRLIKEFWKLALFVVIIMGVDYGAARLVCYWNEWPTNVAWILTGFAIVTLFFWSDIANFSTKKFFKASISWKRKFGAGIAVLLGVIYALSLTVPHIQSLADNLLLIISVPVLVFVTKWLANAFNFFVGFILSAFFGFSYWTQVNREGFRGLNRYGA